MSLMREKYISVLNEKPVVPEIIDAIDKVYLFYHSTENEQILIRPMLYDIKKTGVAMEKYGYIRLENYDILSPRYDEAFDYYFAGESFLASKEARGFQFTKERMERIDLESKRNGIQINSEQIFLFMKEAVEGKLFNQPTQDMIIFFLKILEDR